MNLIGMIVVLIALAGLGAAAWLWGTDSRGCFDQREHGSRDPFQI